MRAALFLILTALILYSMLLIFCIPQKAKAQIQTITVTAHVDEQISFKEESGKIKISTNLNSGLCLQTETHKLHLAQAGEVSAERPKGFFYLSANY